MGKGIATRVGSFFKDVEAKQGSKYLLSEVLQVDRMVKEGKLKICYTSDPLLMKQLKYRKFNP